MKFKLVPYLKYLILIILIILIVLYYKKKPSPIERFNSGINIPKILHQTAPADKSKWHREWFECQASWRQHFPDFEYKLWTDEDNLNLIKNDYPWFLETYNKYPKNIMRIDIIRYFILDKFGGIYADMDYICIRNFYMNLPQDKISISESPFPGEYLQNALMCSPKGHTFWMKVIKKSKARLEKIENNSNVLYITGPQLVSDVYNDNKANIHVLPKDEFNPDKNSQFFNDHGKIYAKHLTTATWVE